MDNSFAQKIEEQKVLMFNCLLNSGFDEETSKKYAALLIEHEIDESILKSRLLNHDLLKELGISVLGHRLK